MRRMGQGPAVLALLVFSVAGWGYPWDKDMVDQPTANPHESEAPAGPGSVPIEGGGNFTCSYDRVGNV